MSVAAPPRVLVSGAGRGLGHALAASYAAAGWEVIATARDPSAARPLAAEAADRITFLPLDVTDPDSIARLATALAGRPLDLLVNNAGIYGPRAAPMGDLDYHAWAEVLETNLFGPMRLTEALLPNLRAGRRRQVATLSSRLASLALNTTGGSYAYRSSKAAVNAAMLSLARDLAGEGFTVVLLSPGWVRTDMGGSGADLAPEESVAGLRRVLDGLTTADNGRFMGHDGSPIPW